jgi:hypothetical protein
VKFSNHVRFQSLTKASLKMIFFLKFSIESFRCSFLRVIMNTNRHVLRKSALKYLVRYEVFPTKSLTIKNTIYYFTLSTIMHLATAADLVRPSVCPKGRAIGGPWMAVHEQSFTTEGLKERVRRINRYTMECGTGTECFVNVFTEL